MSDPTNAELTAIKRCVATALPGTPEWALFPRWNSWDKGRTVVVESTSGSVLARADRETGTLTISERCGGQTLTWREERAS